jgi:hypothetical protein
MHKDVLTSALFTIEINGVMPFNGKHKEPYAYNPRCVLHTWVYAERYQQQKKGEIERVITMTAIAGFLSVPEDKDKF